MSTEKDQAEIELAIFRDFIRLGPLPIDSDSVEKQTGESEPDISCIVLRDGAITFELVEVCDPNLAAMTSRRPVGESSALWTSDPTERIVRQKLRRHYNTCGPVELLCYTRGRVIGVSVTGLCDQPWGWRTFDFPDPDGYTWSYGQSLRGPA